MSKNSEQMTMVLYAALAEPIGLLLEVSDLDQARQALYRARAEAKDEELNQLQFRASPGLEGGNMIIVKQKIQLNGAQAQSAPAQLTDL